MGSSALQCSAQLGGPCVTTLHCGCRIGRCAVDVSSSAGGSGMLSACRGGCAICRHLQGRPCRAPARPGQLAWSLRFPQQWWESAAVGCCAPGGHLPGGHDFQWPASVSGEGPLNAELLMRVPLGVGTSRRLPCRSFAYVPYSSMPVVLVYIVCIVHLCSVMYSVL